MKLFTLLTLFLGAASSLAQAGTITLSDRDANDAKAEMPAALVSTLAGAGLKFKALNDGVYAISAKNLLCEGRHNGALDSADPMMGVYRTNCRVNSESQKDTKKGQALSEAGQLWEQLGKLDLEDCAMGYCAMFVKNLNCTVDTKVETLRGYGRFACTLETEY